MITQTSGAGGVGIAEPRYHLASTTLSITKTASVSQQLPTQDVTYTITVTNPTGSEDAIGAVVTDPLPAGTNFQAETDPGSPWTVSTPSVGSGGTVTFTDTAPFAVGDTATFTITVQINPNVAAGTTLNNTATATSDDSNTPSDTASVLVLGTTLGITKTVSLSQALDGQNATYTIGLTNTGSYDAYNAQVTDALPADVNFQAETDPGQPLDRHFPTGWQRRDRDLHRHGSLCDR